VDPTKFIASEWGRPIATLARPSYAAFMPKHLPRQLTLPRRRSCGSPKLTRLPGGWPDQGACFPILPCWRTLISLARPCRVLGSKAPGVRDGGVRRCRDRRTKRDDFREQGSGTGVRHRGFSDEVLSILGPERGARKFTGLPWPFHSAVHWYELVISAAAEGTRSEVVSPLGSGGSLRCRTSQRGAPTGRRRRDCADVLPSREGRRR
jgi:hypothetical protein